MRPERYDRTVRDGTENMSSINIFDIQHFCVQDGPGIRTSVFMKGCPLRCKWCHNPESQSSRPNLLYYQQKCIGCGMCERVCSQKVHTLSKGHSIDRNKCILCKKCADTCPTNALAIAGESRDINDIMAEITRDKRFYSASGGGVTFTGGEPFLQSEALREMLKLCKEENINTAVETSCYVEPKMFQAISLLSDIMICDLKAVSANLHQELTGVDNRLILDNLNWLAKAYQGQAWIRIPIIPGHNDSDDEIRKISQFISSKALKQVELLAYHDTGKSKYIALGREYECENVISPDKNRMDEIQLQFKNGVANVQ
jgi:pyruvate formate lyase activating enzyme